jgi:hypothetical protein
MLGEKKEHWLELCAQAAVEQDPQRLLALVKQINLLLEEKERSSITSAAFSHFTHSWCNPPFSSRREQRRASAGTTVLRRAQQVAKPGPKNRVSPELVSTVDQKVSCEVCECQRRAGHHLGRIRARQLTDFPRRPDVSARGGRTPKQRGSKRDNRVYDAVCNESAFSCDFSARFCSPCLPCKAATH